MLTFCFLLGELLLDCHVLFFHVILHYVELGHVVKRTSTMPLALVACSFNSFVSVQCDFCLV